MWSYFKFGPVVLRYLYLEAILSCEAGSFRQFWQRALRGTVVIWTRGSEDVVLRFFYMSAHV